MSAVGVVDSADSWATMRSNDVIMRNTTVIDVGGYEGGMRRYHLPRKATQRRHTRSLCPGLYPPRMAPYLGVPGG